MGLRRAGAAHGGDAAPRVDDLLRRAGVVLPPTVYVFAEDLDPPFVYSVQCRRFYRGADAAAAVAELGELPSALAASRLLVAWEEQDLKVALGLPADPDTTALVALDATLTDWTLHRRPCPTRGRHRRRESGPGAGVGRAAAAG